MQWDWTIKVTDLAIVFATLVGPILAVQVQKFLDARREQRARRRALFHALMRTRGTPLNVDHVNALNAVPLEFPKSDSATEQVLEAWKVYMNHFGKDTTAASWGEKRVELLTTLLREMGAHLRYHFDPVELENGVYTPIAHGKVLAEQDMIREGMAAVFRGEKAIPMVVEKLPGDPEVAARWGRVLEKLESELDARQAKIRASGPENDA